MKLTLLALLPGLLLNAQVAAGPARCVFSGMVTDEATGEPIAKARVFARPASSDSAIWTSTDERGKFCIRDADPTGYLLTVGRTGYLPQVVVDEVPGRANRTFNLKPGVYLRKLVDRFGAGRRAGRQSDR